MIYLLAILSYFVGSIPFSYLIPKLISNIDIRKEGSGNTGTTNVLRILGLKVGVFAFVGDFLKGIVPTAIGLLYFGELGGVIAAASSVIGHCYSVWLKFKGGKGVATSAGAMLILTPDVFITLFVIQFLVIFLTKYMSLASILSAALFPLFCFVYSKSITVQIFALFMGLFVIYRHRENVKRLIKGTENKLKIAQKKK